MHIHRVCGQFFGRPLLLTPNAADAIGNFLLSRFAGGATMGGGDGGENNAQKTTTYFPTQAGGDGSLTVHSPVASRFYGETPLTEDGARRPLPYRRTAEGVAIITLVGEWVNRGGYVGASSGVISYEGFKYQLEMVARDPRSKAVILDMESPGGEAVGAFEAGAAVRALAAIKPVWAVVNGLCASAMYAIAASATRIVSIPTGISGSIGVVLAHLDFSEFLKKEGIKPTFIHAGARKVDANPYQPLPDSVRDRLQAEVEDFYDLFVETVVTGRAGLTDKAVRATEAGCFMGAEALELGLVDALGTFEEVLGELSRPSAQPPRPAPSIHTPQPNGTQTVNPNEEASVRADERTRIKNIMDSPEARGREAQAAALATSTTLSADQARAIMNASPRNPVASSADTVASGRRPCGTDRVPAAGRGTQAGAADWGDIAASLNAERSTSATPKQAGAADWGDIAASLTGTGGSASQKTRRTGR